jgi:hypothetical protein
MIRDPKVPFPFKPREDGPTYLLRVPTVADRVRFRRSRVAAGARRWSNMALVRIAREGVTRFLPDDRGNLAREVLTTYLHEASEALAHRERNPGIAADNAFLEAVTFGVDMLRLLNLIAENDREFAQACGDNVVHDEIVGQVAARMFLVGWDRPEPFEKDLEGPSESTLAMIPTADFEAIGREIMPLVEPGEARMGNSPSPSSTPSKEAESSSAGTGSRRNGRSKAATGTATA